MNLIKSLLLLAAAMVTATAAALSAVHFPQYEWYCGWLGGWWCCGLSRAANRALKAYIGGEKVANDFA